VKWTEFWALIDSAVDDPSVVEKRLKTMSEQELVDFFWIYKDRAGVLLEEEYGEQIPEPYSEDHHEDIAEWVVRQGERYFNDVVFDPSTFPGELPDDDDDISYTSLADKEYYDRYGDTMRAPQDPPPPNA
jgi:Protein of unknown function (DUF4240)